VQRLVILILGYRKSGKSSKKKLYLHGKVKLLFVIDKKESKLSHVFF
jgi:hypothetical protein